MVMWEITTLADVADVLNGDRGVNYPKPSEIRLNGVPFINAGHLQDCKIDYGSMEYISHEHYARMGGAKLQSNDILFCLRGSLGKYALYHGNAGALASSLAAIRAAEMKIDSGFLFQLLGSNIIAKQIEQANNGSSQPNLSATDVKKFEIPLPPLPEQHRIAAALSDTDALITALERLIAKKRAIKQGAMQELLTGKRRLPGFKGEWVEKKLGEVALDIKTGKRNNEEKVDSGRYAFFVRSQQVERIDNYSYDCEAILVPGEGNIGQIFHYINGKFDCHQRVYKISNFVGVDAKFIFFYLKLFFGQYALMNTVKATVDSLRLPTFVSFTMNIPLDTDEQTAIAEILSDMDAEIDKLTAKLKKLRNIKQGMMSELLTGRIRLVEQDAATITETSNTVAGRDN